MEYERRLKDGPSKEIKLKLFLNCCSEFLSENWILVVLSVAIEMIFFKMIAHDLRKLWEEVDIAK